MKPKSRIARYEVLVRVVAEDGESEFRLRPMGESRSGGAWRLVKVVGGKATRQVYVLRRHPIDGEVTCDCLSWLRWNTCRHAEMMSLLVSGEVEPGGGNA